MKKTFIRLNDEGNPTSVFTTNSKNIVLKKGIIIDVTRSKDKDKISSNPNHFKFKDNKIVELSNVEKEKSDKPILPPKPVLETKILLEEITKLKERLKILEKK